MHTGFLDIGRSVVYGIRQCEVLTLGCGRLDRGWPYLLIRVSILLPLSRVALGSASSFTLGTAGSRADNPRVPYSEIILNNKNDIHILDAKKLFHQFRFHMKLPKVLMQG